MASGVPSIENVMRKGIEIVLADALLILGLILAGGQWPHASATEPVDAGYTVQIQAAPAVARSRLLQTYEDLKTKGYLVCCRDAHVNDRAYVRLRTGLFKTRNEARRHAEAIHKSEGFDYFVTPTRLPVDSFGDLFDIVTTPNDIWFRSATSLRPLYHFDTARDAASCRGARICPAGRHIAFSCHNQLVRIDLRDDSIHVLKQGEGEDALFNSVLAWSPDGRHIAYLDRAEWELPTRLWIMQSDGSRDRCLAGDDTGQTRVKSLQWHPSGSEVLYVSGPAHGTVSVGGSLCRVDLDGRREVVVPSDRRERTEVCSAFRIVGNEVQYRLAHFDEDHQIRQYSTRTLLLDR